MKIEKVEKHVANLQDKKEYVKHKRKLKQALNHGLIMYEFLYDCLKPNVEKNRNHVTSIQRALEPALKQKTFTQTFQKMLKQD